MSKIIFDTVTPESPDKDLVEAIYNEAFPKNERKLSFGELLQIGQVLETSKMKAAYEDGKIIGLMYYLEFDEYFYLLYFAINSELRGSGYGSKLIRAFLEMFPEKAVIGAIETPIPGTFNYEQRVKRKAFWERLNLFMTKYSLGTSDDTMFTLVANCQDNIAIGYFVSFLKFFQQIAGAQNESLSESSSAAMKFYKTENGNIKEVSPSEWVI